MRQHGEFWFRTRSADDRRRRRAYVPSKRGECGAKQDEEAWRTILTTSCSRHVAACIDGAADSRCLRVCAPVVDITTYKRAWMRRVRRHETAGAHSAVHRNAQRPGGRCRPSPSHCRPRHPLRPPRLPEAPWPAFLRRAVSAGGRMRAVLRRSGTSAGRLKLH